MPRPTMLLMAFALTLASPVAAAAGDIDGLKGRYAFDWFKDPASTKCVEVGDALLATFKSAEFTCDLSDHPTSGKSPAKMCSKAGGGSEYLILDTLAHCEEERETQAAAE